MPVIKVISISLCLSRRLPDGSYCYVLKKEQLKRYNGNSLDNFFMANQRKRNDNFVQVASERRAAL